MSTILPASTSSPTSSPTSAPQQRPSQQRPSQQLPSQQLPSQELPFEKRPCARVLQLLRIGHLKPEAVFCASCRDRNDERGVFLFLRYGRVGLYPTHRGKGRIEWSVCLGRFCDQAHYTMVKPDGTLAHTPNLG